MDIKVRRSGAPLVADDDSHDVEQRLGNEGLPSEFPNIQEALRSGQSKEQIISRIMESGYKRRIAVSLVSSAEFHMGCQSKQQYREFPVWDFLIGVSCILIGAAISYGTYTSAGPGAAYVIWWGIVAYGGFRVLRGIVRLVGGGD